LIIPVSYTSFGASLKLTVKVFYTERQTASRNLSFSPSAQKPALVVAAWQQLGLPLEIIEPRPASLTDLCRAHDPAYVRGVLAGRIPNGFGNTSSEINATLPWTNGSMISAAEWAVTNGVSVFSPTSGFHHAGWNYGAAFCTFNGLMVAALALKQKHLVRRVAILDLDQHFGDGTRDIIRTLGLDWVSHYTYGEKPATPETAEKWLRALPEIVRETVSGCDLVLYQASADPHVDDPLGRGLTSDQLATRDRIVFEMCSDLGVPVVSCLAGGYQKPIERVVSLHAATMHQYIAVQGPVN
jgi:acetoin utilization deacetylase AcuC-like enzyme